MGFVPPPRALSEQQYRSAGYRDVEFEKWLRYSNGIGPIFRLLDWITGYKIENHPENDKLKLGKGATMSKLDELIEKHGEGHCECNYPEKGCGDVLMYESSIKDYTDSLISALKDEMEGFNGVAILRKQVDLAYNALKGESNERENI
jgi:hypothetical protein